MTKQIPETWAEMHIAAIGIFCLVSGIWEFLVGIGPVDIRMMDDFLLSLHWRYLCILGIITFFSAIFLFFRINFFRLVVIAIAWWNLFTAPLIAIWYYIYVGIIKKFLSINFSISSCTSLFILFSIMTLIRIYIIRTLSISRAGSIFIKKNSRHPTFVHRGGGHG